MLTHLPLALIATQPLTSIEARSALPGAPVQPHHGPALRTVRTRRAVAGALHRAAHVVSPA
jgi:hypothetical protein